MTQLLWHAGLLGTAPRGLLRGAWTLLAFSGLPFARLTFVAFPFVPERSTTPVFSAFTRRPFTASAREREHAEADAAVVLVQRHQSVQGVRPSCCGFASCAALTGNQGPQLTVRLDDGPDSGFVITRGGGNNFSRDARGLQS